MINIPKTRKEAEKLNYGNTYARVAYDSEHCAYRVAEQGRITRFHQCTRSPGFGPAKMYCRQHDPASIAERERKSSERYRKEMDRLTAPSRKIKQYERALRKIKSRRYSGTACAQIAEDALTRGGAK